MKIQSLNQWQLFLVLALTLALSSCANTSLVKSSSPRVEQSQIAKFLENQRWMIDSAVDADGTIIEALP